MLSSTLERRAGLQSSGDYTGYRKYASRRLKKLRQRENVTVKSTQTYKPHPLRPGQWQLALLLAERSWAAAMAARAALDVDATSSPAVLKSQISSKLVKAVKYASDVLAAQPSDVDAKTKLEFTVYASLIAGETALEKQQWPKVIDEFSKVRVGLVALSKSRTDNIFSDVLSTKVDPGLRLALSQNSADEALDISDSARKTVIDKYSDFAELVRTVNSQALSETSAKSHISQITFRQHTAQVRYNSLAEILLNCQARTQELQKSSTSTTIDTGVFEGVLNTYAQLEFATTNLISEISSTGQQREQDLDIILTYAKFNLLKYRIERDCVVAQQELGKTNAIRLYDVVLQSCTSMAELPGVYNDDELAAGIQEMQRFFQTKRTLAAAVLQELGSVEALALINFAYKRLGDDETMPDASINADDLDLPVKPKDIKALKAEVLQQLARTHSLTLLLKEVQNRSRTKGSVASDLGFKQLSQSHRPLVVCDLEAKHIDACPVKPVFYDVAYNYVTAQEEAGDNELAAASTTGSEGEPINSDASEQTPKKRGLFGLF